MLSKANPHLLRSFFAGVFPLLKGKITRRCGSLDAFLLFSGLVKSNTIKCWGDMGVEWKVPVFDGLLGA